MLNAKNDWLQCSVCRRSDDEYSEGCTDDGFLEKTPNFEEIDGQLICSNCLNGE